MRNLSMLNPIFYVLFLFCLLCHISVSTSTPRYTAVDNITLNCGSLGHSTAMDKREWIGDINSKFTPIEEANASTTAPIKASSVVNTAPYLTARLSYSQFMYEFHLSTTGPKFVRLYFHPVSYQGFEGSQDFFTVKAGSFTLLRNFSASIHANYLNEETLSKEFGINVEKDQMLNLTFIPSPSTSSKFYAFINEIEIVSMPNNLYYDVQEGPRIPFYIGQSTQFPINYELALEKVFLINVGEGFISPVDDCGMYRAWSQQDNSYWFGRGVIPHRVSFTPNYTEISNYTAPDDIYRSAVSMGPNTTKNMDSNLTLKLPVDPGFKYLVRLHFCEMVFPVTEPSQREFNIYIDNQMAEEGADVILWTRKNETPVYKDYVVYIQNKPNLFIALLPIISAVSIADVILNGVEVFKLCDNDKNLAGPNPEISPPPAQQAASTSSESKTKKTIIIGIGSGAAGFLVVLTLVCCMLLWKLRKTKPYDSYYLLSKCWCWPKPMAEPGKCLRRGGSQTKII